MRSAAFTLKKEVDRLTVEYANAIKILEEIGLNAEKGESFSTIQGAIKVLRVELDRELDMSEMNRFRSEVVLLDPDEEMRRGNAETASPETSRRRLQDSKQDEIRETEMQFSGGVPEGGASTGRIGVSGVSGTTGPYMASQTRRPVVREADTDRIQIRLSSMKIEKVASGKHDTSVTQDPANVAYEADETDGELIKCRNCGTKISRKSIVCVSCGEFLR
ncbi:MAG: hypothetical protein KIS29_07970 [Thermoplasmata archaeon]|nr:hypothetical protein [Candidatus Sysuiplasma jiujiangense]